MPMGLKPEVLAPLVKEYRRLASGLNKPDPKIVTMASLPLQDLGESREVLEAYAEAGATTVIYGQRYETAAELKRSIELLSKL